VDISVSVLSHPLTVLVVGAALSGWLIPRFTRRWQDERKSLEIKADLVERASRAVMELVAATQFVIVGAQSQSQEDFDNRYRAWLLDKAVLSAVLGAYFRNGSTIDAWVRCRALATAYYVQAGIRREDVQSTLAARRSYLQKVSSCLNADPPIDLADGLVGGPEIEALTPGADLSNTNVLRTALDTSLVECVEAIVDNKLTLAR
jgi:hypothetical protein